MKLKLEGIFTGHYGNKFAVVRFHMDAEYRGKPLIGILTMDESALRPRVKVQDQERILSDLVAELIEKVNGVDNDSGDEAVTSHTCAEANAAKED